MTDNTDNTDSIVFEETENGLSATLAEEQKGNSEENTNREGTSYEAQDVTFEETDQGVTATIDADKGGDGA